MGQAGAFQVERFGQTISVTPLRNLLALETDDLLTCDAGGAFGILEAKQAKDVVICGGSF